MQPGPTAAHPGTRGLIVAEWIGIVVSVLSLAVAGLLAWIWQLWSSHNELKLHLAQNYLSRPDHEKAQDASERRIRRMERMLQVMYGMTVQIAAKLDVRVASSDPFSAADEE